MDLKFYDHDGRRWMEGDFEGRWFMLSEDGTRLVLETPMYGYGCFEGATADDFTGHRVGVLCDRQHACEWVCGTNTRDPQRIDRENQTRGDLTIPLGTPEAETCS